MKSYGKDSPKVVEFMTLFARLKEWSDDAPEDLVDLAAGDEGVKDLCAKLSMAAFMLTMNERRARTLFAAPVDPAFIASWRDYEHRYQKVASDIWLADLLPEVVYKKEADVKKADLQWDMANDDAGEQAAGIVDAIEFARFNVDQEYRWVDQPDFIERVQDGIAAWERMEKDTGFDLQGVFRRRALIPFVLVPRHVSAQHGSAETLSMLKNLQHAHDAFVFGATHAALALMRSILEGMLRDHYGAHGKDLNERIWNARHQLPPGVNAAALHRLRLRANAILHLDKERHEELPKLDAVGLEKEIVSLLSVLRNLIEGAKA